MSHTKLDPDHQESNPVSDDHGADKHGDGTATHGDAAAPHDHTGGRRRRKSHHRRKSHRGRHRRGGSAALTRFAVPASLYALKQLMEKRSSRKFVRGVDKSLGRPGTTIMRDVTKGFVGTVDAAGSIVGLNGKKSRRKSRRKSRKSRRKSRRSRRR